MTTATECSVPLREDEFCRSLVIATPATDRGKDSAVGLAANALVVRPSGAAGASPDEKHAGSHGASSPRLARSDETVGALSVLVARTTAPTGWPVVAAADAQQNRNGRIGRRCRDHHCVAY